MRGSRAVIVAGGCASILGAGWVAAPDELPALDLAEPTPSATPDAGESSSPEASSPASQTFDGPAITNARGAYQARITVVDGVVTDVQAVVAGTSAAESVAINATAIPELRTRVLEAQTWDVEAVSGASFTSPAFIESLEAAFAEAGL